MKERNSNALACILFMSKGTVTLVTKTYNLFCDYFSPGVWGGGYFWEILVGVCRPVLQILPLFQTQKCHSPHPFSDLASNVIGSLSDLKLLRSESQHKIHSEFACFLAFLFIWN